MFWWLHNNCIWMESLCMEAYLQFNHGMMIRDCVRNGAEQQALDVLTHERVKLGTSATYHNISKKINTKQSPPRSSCRISSLFCLPLEHEQSARKPLSICQESLVFMTMWKTMCAPFAWSKWSRLHFGWPSGVALLVMQWLCTETTRPPKRSISEVLRGGCGDYIITPRIGAIRCMPILSYTN